MKARGYLTPCDRSEPSYDRNGKRVACEATARLTKPGKWRCEACSTVYGKLRVDP